MDELPFVEPFPYPDVAARSKHDRYYIGKHMNTQAVQTKPAVDQLHLKPSMSNVDYLGYLQSTKEHIDNLLSDMEEDASIDPDVWDDAMYLAELSPTSQERERQERAATLECMLEMELMDTPAQPPWNAIHAGLEFTAAAPTLSSSSYLHELDSLLEKDGMSCILPDVALPDFIFCSHLRLQAGSTSGYMTRAQRREKILGSALPKCFRNCIR